MRDYSAKDYTGTKARYIGRDGGQTWGAAVLSTGDLVPDPQGLLVVKAPRLFAPAHPETPARADPKKED